MDDNYLNLYDYCTVSCGYTRGAIFDLKNQRQWFIPLSWATVLSAAKNINLNEFRLNSNYKTEEDLRSFLQFLLDEGIVYFSSRKERIKNQRKTKRAPTISLAVISVDVVSSVPRLPYQTLVELQVKRLILYVHKPVNLITYLNHYNGADLHTLELIITFKGVNSAYLNDLVRLFPLLQRIEIPDPIPEEIHPSVQVLICSKNPLDNGLKKYVHLINETQANAAGAHHTYYFKRAHITAKGLVKNSPHTKETFGNLKKKTLKEIVQQTDFQVLWHVPKSKIDVCSDCEFRAVCVDSRPLKKRGNGSWYALEECVYNPYICLKEGQEGYKSLVECGVNCTKQGFSIEVDLFIAMKARFWGEMQLNR